MAQDDFNQFLERVKQAESRGRRYDKDGNLLTSPKGAQGEMQVMPKTQRDPGYGVVPAKSRAPEEIARVGRDYLKAMDDRYGGNKAYAAVAYNWGPSNADKWIAAGADFSKLPKETRDYVAKVTGSVPRETQAAPVAAEPSEAEKIMKPALESGMTAQAPATPASDLGSGYKAALALSFLGAEDADKPESEDDLQARLDREEEDTAAQQFAQYKPYNALAELDLSSTPAPQPVRLAGGGTPGGREDTQQAVIDEGLSDDPRSFLSRASDAVQRAARQGLDAMFPIRRIVRAGVEPSAKAAIQQFEQAVQENPQAYLENKNFAENLARQAHFHIKNAGRKAVGLEPFEDRSAPYLGPISENSFPDPNSRTPPELRTPVDLSPLRRSRSVKLAEGGEVQGLTDDAVDAQEILANREAGFANTRPPTRSAQQLQAYMQAMNPTVQVSERPLEPGLLGYVDPEPVLGTPGKPNVLNINAQQSPGTAEMTKLHELEHVMDLRGGDIRSRPHIRYTDNNMRAYYLMGRDWQPINEMVENVVNNKQKIEQFFGRPIESGYFRTQSLENLKSSGDQRALFKEQLATLSALEQATGKSLTRDPEMRAIFPNTKMMAVYDALTGPRQTRLDARDLPPHTPQPSYTYETNPILRFIKEKMAPSNEYGIPVKRADGSPETGEVGPYVGNPNIQRQGEAARRLAAMRDVNTLPDPKTYAATAGFLGIAPDEQGFSVAHPDIAGIKKAGEAGFYAGTAAQVAPIVGPAAKALGKMVGSGINERLLAGQSLTPGFNTPAPVNFAVRPRGGPLLQQEVRRGETWTNAQGENISPNGAVDPLVPMMHDLAGLPDKPLGEWFRNKVGAYIRRDMGSPDDQFVKAADEGKRLHFLQKPSKDYTEEQLHKDIGFSVKGIRKTEGFNPEGEAKTMYGKLVEGRIDLPIEPVRAGDLTFTADERLIPPSMRAQAIADPEMRFYGLDTYINKALGLEDLRNYMYKMRNTSPEFSAYHQPNVQIPERYRFTDEALKGLTPAQASERVAQAENWFQETRQKMASAAVNQNPQLISHKYDNGSKWASFPDLGEHSELRQLVQDVGCDGGWCTKETNYALRYGSEDGKRLNILFDSKGRPKAQLTFQEQTATPNDFISTLEGSDYDNFMKRHSHISEINNADRPSTPFEFENMMEDIANTPEYRSWASKQSARITEIKGVGNTRDLTDAPFVGEVQDFVKRMDKQHRLQSVENLDGIGMADLTTARNPSSIIGSEINRQVGSYSGFVTQKILESMQKLNEGSSYVVAKDLPDLVKQAIDDVMGPMKHATGGMIERRTDDSRKYL